MDSTDTPEEGRRLLRKLELRLRSELDIASLGRPSKLPFKVASLRELSLHRAVDLMRAALNCYDASTFVPAVILTRALMETAAVLYAVRELVEEVCSTGKLEASTDERLMQLIFGGRVEQAPERAINILTHFDKLGREFKGVREWYGQLSEVAHPNYLGLLGTYGEIDRTKFMVTLGPNTNYQGMGPRFGLPALLTAAEMVVSFSDTIQTSFESFSRVCHESPSLTK